MPTPLSELVVALTDGGEDVFENEWPDSDDWDYTDHEFEVLAHVESDIEGQPLRVDRLFWKRVGQGKWEVERRLAVAHYPTGSWSRIFTRRA